MARRRGQGTAGLSCEKGGEGGSKRGRLALLGTIEREEDDTLSLFPPKNEREKKKGRKIFFLPRKEKVNKKEGEGSTPNPQWKEGDDS